MTGYDPWLPPPAGGYAAPPRRNPLPAILIGLLVVVVLAAGVTWVVRRRGGGGGGTANTPDGAVETWLRAANSGDVERIRAAVAPSQRQYVDPADPTGVGPLDLDLDDEVSVGTADGARLAPDEMYVDVFGGTVCRDEPRRACFELKGSGPRDRVLVVREAGRWWVVAAPVKLVEPPRRQPTTPPTG